MSQARILEFVGSQQTLPSSEGLRTKKKETERGRGKKKRGENRKKRKKRKEEKQGRKEEEKHRGVMSKGNSELTDEHLNERHTLSDSDQVTPIFFFFFCARKN